MSPRTRPQESSFSHGRLGLETSKLRTLATLTSLSAWETESQMRGRWSIAISSRVGRAISKASKEAFLLRFGILVSQSYLLKCLFFHGRRSFNCVHGIEASIVTRDTRVERRARGEAVGLGNWGFGRNVLRRTRVRRRRAVREGYPHTKDRRYESNDSLLIENGSFSSTRSRCFEEPGELGYLRQKLCFSGGEGYAAMRD